MRYLFLFSLNFLCIACATDLATEDLGSDQNYSFAELAGGPAAVAVSGEPDTLPLPTASKNDRVSPKKGGQAPTPYGMEIEPEPTSQLGAKGIASANRSAPALAAQKMLTGRWINTQDVKEQVAFSPTHYKTYYEGELLLEEDMTYHQICPDACTGGLAIDEPCFTITGPAQTDCYGIVRLTDEELELQLLGVSNKTIVYRKGD